MAVSPGEQEDIRQMDRDGVPRARIAREPSPSRNTVSRYADRQDMSPEAPVSKRRAHPATDGLASWIDATLASDQAVPGRQRHTAQRTFDRAVAEKGHAGPCPSTRRHAATWKREHVQGPREGFPGPRWAPGTAQVDFGSFEAQVAGQGLALRLLVVSLPHPDARLCVALPPEKAEALCWGLRHVLEWVGRAPRTLVPDDATEAGGTVFGKVTESRPSSQFRAHYRCESRHRDPCSGNERGSVEDAVGLLRRNLLVPVPQATSPDGPDEALRRGCDEMGVQARNGAGVAAQEAFVEDLASMLALPGVVLDAAGWGQGEARQAWIRPRGRQPLLRGPCLARPRARGGRARKDGGGPCRPRQACGNAWPQPQRRRAREKPRLAGSRPYGTSPRLRGARHRGGYARWPGGCHRPAGQGREEAGLARACRDGRDVRAQSRLRGRGAHPRGRQDSRRSVGRHTRQAHGGRTPRGGKRARPRRLRRPPCEGGGLGGRVRCHGGRDCRRRQEMPARQGSASRVGRQGRTPPGRAPRGPPRGRVPKQGRPQAREPPGKVCASPAQGPRRPRMGPDRLARGVRQGRPRLPLLSGRPRGPGAYGGASVLAGPTWQRPCAPLAARTPVPPVSSPRRLW